MKKLKLSIIECPTNSYKITGEPVSEYYEEALKKGNELYLGLYENVYKKLMFRDFNILWTPDTFSTNDIDPKDGFWAMGYFFFNVALIRLLSKKYEIEVVDKTGSDFRNQKELFKFLISEGIIYEINEKKIRNKSFLNSLKKFIKRSPRNVIEKIENGLRFLKEEISESRTGPEVPFKKMSGEKIVYLTIPPIGDMSVKDYLRWRYHSLFKKLIYHKQGGNRVVLVGTKDFKDSDDFDYPFINAFRFLTKKDRLKIAFKILLLKVRTKIFIWSERMKPGRTPIEKYFLSHIPTKLYYGVKENVAYDHLFKTCGPGLLIMKGPIVYKGACIHNYNARKYGVRVLSIAGRILAPNRPTNCFLDVHHRDVEFPNVLPHSIMLSDRISFESIRKQNKEMHIYSYGTTWQKVSEHESVHSPFTITLALQKKKEMEAMIDAVISAVQNMEDVVVNLKMHPDLPMPPKLKKKYGKMPFVNILSIDTPLNEAVDMSDLCVTAYSTSAFEFAKKMKPIVWINYVTLNSLFFTEVHKKLGLVAGNNDELKQIFRRMKEDREYYNEHKKNHYYQLKNLIFETDNELIDPFNIVINEELGRLNSKNRLIDLPYAYRTSDGKRKQSNN